MTCVGSQRHNKKKKNLQQLDARLISHHSVSTQTQACAYVIQETYVYRYSALTVQFGVQNSSLLKGAQKRGTASFCLNP